MMNMVSLIAGQVQTRQELFSNEGEIMEALMSSGYRLHEIDAAITLMQSLAQDDTHSSARSRSLTGMRTMTVEERKRISLDAFGLVIKLSVLGIVSEDQREDIIEKTLTLHRGRIDLAAVKALLALNLFGDPEDFEDLVSAAKKHHVSAWN